MNASPRLFHGRAFTSVLMAVAFLVLAVSGAILFLAPPGRVANWTNWTILGLRKSEWTALHIWFAVVFLAGSAVHLWYNLRPMLLYFQERASRRVAFRREWVVAAAFCVGVTVGTLADIAPFKSFLAWNESIKESWDQPAERAPIPHAELLTVAELAQKAGIDLPTATARLNAKGITGFAADTVVQKLADDAKLSAQQVYAIITTPTGTAQHSGAAGGGLGWKTLAQFCADEGIELNTAVARLEKFGVKATAEKTLRELATENGGRKPYELVETIRGTE